MATASVMLCLFLTFLSTASSETDEALDYIKLREQLLVKNFYNREIRPVKDHRTTTLVYIRLILMQITDLSSNTLSLDLYIYSMWRDEQLQWDPSSYNNLTKVEFEFNELWTPDIIAWNSIDRSVQDLSASRLAVNSTGYVTWISKGSFKTFCALSFRDYPFDTQRCHITFGSWMYFVREVNMTTYYGGSSQVVRGPFIANPEWQYMNVSSKLWARSDEGFAVITIDITLKRKLDAYNYLVFIPYLSASLLVVTTFLTPIGSKYRYLYTNLAVGIFIVLLFYISFQIGIYGTSAPYAIRCLSNNLLMSIIFLLISTLLHFQCGSLIRKKVNPPQFLTTFLELKWLNTILCSTTKSERSLVTENDEESVTELRVNLTSKWTVLLELIDRLCCFLYVLLWIVFHT